MVTTLLVMGLVVVLVLGYIAYKAKKEFKVTRDADSVTVEGSISIGE